MDEIKIYLDVDKQNEVQGSLEFEEVVAGETTTRNIYVFNATKYPMDIELNLSGENVKISKTIEKLAPDATEEVEFEFTPKITLMKPISAKLNIKLNYVVR